MKKLILILSLLICSLTSSATNIDDTTKSQTYLQEILKNETVKIIFNCFQSANFDSLTYCLKNHIVLYLKLDSATHRDRVADDKVINMLNSVFNTLYYEEFRILSSKSEFGEDIILVEVYIKNEESNIFTLNIYFMLNKSKTISEIAIIY